MSQRPLKVAALITDVDGSSMARCFTAYNYLENHGRIEMLTKWQIFDADVVVLHRHWLTDTQSLVKKLQSHGIRVAVDVDDDYFNVPKGNPAWHEHQQPQVREAIKRVLKRADHVFVSTDNLSAKCAHYSDRISLVPNALDLDLWPARQPAIGDEVVTIGFAGSLSHREDLNLLRGVPGKLLRRYPNRIRMVFMGTIPEWLAEDVGPAGTASVRTLPLVPVTSYPKALRDAALDIGLAPLAANPFNEARSNLKFLEYSAAGAATVASRVGPFRDPALPLISVGPRPADWFDAICRLIDNPSLRRSQAAMARGWIQQYDVANLAEKTLQALEATCPDRARVPLRRVPEPFEAKRPVTVIMPVHNAPDLTRAALAAVVPELGPNKHLLIVNDGSTDPAMEEILDGAVCDATVGETAYARRYEWEKPRGFVAAVNLGIKECPGRDVILLNSDTRVSPGFIDRLRKTAYSHPRFGTVTAVSNHGSIASVPDLIDTRRLCGMLDDVVLAPTAVGHCMYIRRDALDKFGALDPVFGRGYGEENDFSLRIAEDFDSVIDLGCYVWHKGSASFSSAEKRKLQAANMETLTSRYPHYLFEVFCFQNSDPLRAARSRMLRDSSDPRLRVLTIAHSYEAAAGTERHIHDLAQGLSDTTLSFIAVPDLYRRGGLHLYQGHTHFGVRKYLEADWPITQSELPLMIDSWNSILEEVRPQVIHLQHLLRHPIGLIDRLAGCGLPLVVSVHDHYFLCPDYTLMSCPGTDQCCSCFAKHFHGAGHPDYQTYRRGLFGEALGKAAAIVAPSHDTARRLNEVYPNLRVRVIPHGCASIYASRPEPRPDEPVRFGYIGNLTPQKGIDILLPAFTRAAQKTNCELHVWGTAGPQYIERATGKIVYHGGYRTEDLPEILSSFDIGVIPSISPETYCYTLSELALAGVPAIVSAIGALDERVEHGVSGWKVPPNNVLSWEQALIEVASSPEVRASMRQKCPKVRTLEDMCADYDALYQEMITL